MNRVQFTIKIARLLDDMYTAGDNPVLDWAMRNAEVQKILFDKGLSKCDGYIKKSQHQRGIAVDIYLADENGNIKFEWDSAKAEHWHKIWKELYGGNEMISWDLGHFEASIE